MTSTDTPSPQPAGHPSARAPLPPPPPSGGASGNERDLTEGPVLGHLVALALPAALAMLFHTFQNVTDAWYAGWIGPDALAGLSMATAVFFLILSLGFGIGAGVNALAGAAMGAGERARAAAFAAQGLSFGLLISAVLTLGGWALAPQLLDLMGATGGPRDAARDYLLTVCLGAAFFVLAYAAYGALATQGDAKSFQRAQMGAAAANLLLDPLFVWGFGWGVTGIAVATVLAQAGVCGWMLRRALRSGLLRPAPWRAFRPDARVIAEIARQAFPASLNMLVATVGMFMVLHWLQRFGGAAVAGYGAALRIEQILLLPALGLSGALLPLVARNHGAKRPERVRETVRLGLLIGLAMMAAAAVALTLFGEWAVGLFADDPAVIAQGVRYFEFARFTMPAVFAMFAATALLQGLRKPFWPVAVGVFRQTLCQLGFGWLFVVHFDLGVEGVWWTIVSSVALGVGLSWWIAARTLRRELPTG
ncbi:MAG: MATE family efflux transporter [Pseudomonadota bacterium]|nr:MATE family efflux transporter [Pseudomonadota bacterium]